MQKSFDALRDRSITTAEFRSAARSVCDHLMRKTRTHVRKQGIDPKDIVIVVILRAALAFFDAALGEFPDAPVGVLGLKRDERTLNPYWYYENLPLLSKKHAIIILDPMLATGGSAEAAVKRLEKRGADPRRTYFVGVVAAPEGISHLTELIPRENIIVAAIDKGLDEQGMIVPGVGDFGDRYFGYVGRAIID